MNPPNLHREPPPPANRTSNRLSAAAVGLWLAAGIVTLYLWPNGDDCSSPAQAITAGGTFLTAGCVLWVGSVLSRK
jgi:hypothetical protein